MKKIATILSIFLLEACGVHAGNLNILPNQNSIFELWKTESIFYYEHPQDEEVLTASKTITEDKIEKDVTLEAKTGGLMAFSHTYRTDFYDKEVLKVNKHAILDSTSAPYHIRKGAEYVGFGEVTIDGNVYMLVRQGTKENDILLVNADGEVYNRIGRIVKGRLALLDYIFYPKPDDVRFIPVVSSRSERSSYLDGFELRFDGVKNGKMFFVYTILGEDCYDEDFAFPVNTRQFQIKDLTIDVLSVSNDAIEYQIH